MPLQGHPKDWVGKPFRWENSDAVVKVTSYEPGAGGPWIVVYVYTQSPAVPEWVGQERRTEPELFRQLFVPYDPDAPKPEPYLPLQLVPRRRKDLH